MSRPKNKSELLELSGKNFVRLNSLVDSYSSDLLQDEFPEGYLNRNIRDVLAHLHHWHLLLLQWYEIGMAGERPDMPAKGYTWKSMPDLNREIRKKYQNTDLHRVRKMLQKSFNQVMAIIEKHTDAELFEKKRYNWTGSTSLGAYLISATSSHYDWAYKLINKCMKDVQLVKGNTYTLVSTVWGYTR